jgi:TonB family protein
MAMLCARLACAVTLTTLAATAPALQAADEAVADSPGVSVSLNGSSLLHRTPVRYPNNARQQGIQGTVIVDATLDGSGNVADARVVSGPMELRRAVLQSVLEWHFARNAANTTRQINVQFLLPEGETLRRSGPPFVPAVVVSQASPAGPLGRRVSSIEILGLPSEAKEELTKLLPVHVGDVLTEEVAQNTGQVVKEFDKHLSFGFQAAPDGGIAIVIMAPGVGPRLPEPLTASSGRLRIPGPVQQAKLKTSVPPQYPALARQARIQGTVKLHAVVGKSGTIENLSVISGHPLLVPAALEAVKQWVYEPTAVNGEPIAVETDIEVNFSLPPA